MALTCQGECDTRDSSISACTPARFQLYLHPLHYLPPSTNIRQAQSLPHFPHISSNLSLSCDSPCSPPAFTPVACTAVASGRRPREISFGLCNKTIPSLSLVRLAVRWVYSLCNFLPGTAPRTLQVNVCLLPVPCCSRSLQVFCRSFSNLNDYLTQPIPQSPLLC